MNNKDFEMAMAVVGILENMEDDLMFLSTIGMCIDAYAHRTESTVDETLKMLTTIVKQVNNLLGPVTEKVGPNVKLTFKNLEVQS